MWAEGWEPLEFLRLQIETMRRYSMPNREAAAKIFPKSRKDRNTLWKIGASLALMALFVVTVLFFQHRRQEEMENSWESATATIEEVRPVVASQAARGMLYRPEVLAHYKANGSE